MRVSVGEQCGCPRGINKTVRASRMKCCTSSEVFFLCFYHLGFPECQDKGSRRKQNTSRLEKEAKPGCSVQKSQQLFIHVPSFHSSFLVQLITIPWLHMNKKPPRSIKTINASPHKSTLSPGRGQDRPNIKTGRVLVVRNEV